MHEQGKPQLEHLCLLFCEGIAVNMGHDLYYSYKLHIQAQDECKNSYFFRSRHEKTLKDICWLCYSYNQENITIP